ncbi:MAG: hypothetical protein KDK33_06225 [Leptospiraceae bacterium]|nr:hypothetical protein [Leptospiraceae bacterium]
MYKKKRPLMWLAGLFLALSFPIISTCDVASTGCMTGDPDCSTSSLIAMIASLPAGRALYWGDANDNGIYKAELGTREAELMKISPEYPQVLEITPSHDWLWYVGGSGGTLYRMDVPAGNPAVFDSSYQDPFAIQFDESTGILYASDNGAGELDTAVADWTSNTALGFPSAPMGMAIDPENEKLYLNDSSNIQRFALDYTGSTTLVTGAGNVYDLELDIADDKMYWVDRAGKTIQSANLDGTGVTTLLGGLTQIQGLAIDRTNERIYYCDSGTQEIGRLNTDGTNNQIVFTSVACRDVDIAQNYLVSR